MLADPQLVARGLFLEQGGVKYLRTPLDFGPAQVRPAPKLGEHNKDVLG